MSRSTRLTAALAAMLTVACSAPAPAPSPSDTPAPTPAITCAPGVTIPPSASIDDVNGDAVVGEVILYNFCGSAGGLSPETDTTVALSADALNVVISTSDGPPFVAWKVTADAAGAAESAATSFTSVVLADSRNNDGVQTVSFAGPPAGVWNVTAMLTFAGPTGVASYFWKVSSPQR